MIKYLEHCLVLKKVGNIESLDYLAKPKVVNHECKTAIKYNNKPPINDISALVLPVFALV